MSPTPEDVQLIIDQVRQFVQREVVPAEPEIEERDEIPQRLVAGAKAMGLFGFAIPQEYGGLGFPTNAPPCGGADAIVVTHPGGMG